MKHFLQLTTTLILLMFLGGNAWGQEVLLNGTFESWDNTTTPTSWTHIENITQESSGTLIHGGTYSAKHTATATRDLGQTISGIVGGDEYTLTLWYKVTAGDATSARIWSYWKNGSSTLDDHANELRGPNNSYFDNNSAEWTTYSVTLTAPATANNFYFEVRTYSGATVYWDDFSFFHTESTPSAVALSDNGTQIATANIPQGTTDHILHKFQLAVTDANASLTGMTCTTAGTYASADITNLKVWYSTDATLEAGDATLSTLTTTGTAGQQTFTTFTSQTIDINTTGYIFITADIATDATHGNTISINAIATADLTIANTSLSGSTTAGGAQTFQDENGPIVSVYNPLDDAEEVAIDSDLVLTFDENIQKGTTGDITIKKISDNSTVQTIAVTSVDVSITDATLTINPSDLAIGTRYYVEIAAGAIEDIQGNDYAGISGTATWNFTTVAPSVTNVTSTNADGLYTIDDIITIRADFTANVSITTDGNPYILLDMVESDRQASYASGTGTSTLFFTYTIQDSDEAADLDYVANNSLYTNGGTITSDDGVAANRTLPEPGSGNSISGQKAIVVDGVRPSVTDYSPADGSTDVTLDQDLVLTFSENVQQGTSGTVTIYNGGGVVEFESIPFDDGRITISTNTVTINPTGTFSYASNYYVKISNNVITDENGNSYTGITDETTWNFTTESGPESLPLTESFDNSTFPANWTYMNFTIENSSNAGGSPYETRLQYTAANPGTSHLATPAINTSSETTLSLSWNQKVDFYEGGTGTDFIIQVLTSTDGTTYTNVTSQQTVTADETEQKTITLTADDGVGSGTLYIKWLYFQNNTNRFTSWFIDNVFLGLSEPSSHPTSFGALANGTDQIDLTWVDSDAEHYLIKGSTVDFDDITAPTDGVAEADGGLVKNVDAGTQAHSFTGLDANTTYYFKIFPYNGVTTMINYKIDGAQQAQAITADLYDRNSVVDGPETVSQPNPTLISSLVDTDGEAIRVFDMIVRDYGTSDGVDTKITQITINDGANNNADWSNEIQGIKLSVDGGSTFVTIGSPTIEAASIVVPIVSGNLDIPDGEALTVSLYIYLKTSGLTDNAIFEFMIDKDAHGFLADAAGSGFATTFTNSTISNEILLDVVTTKFVYDQQPSNVNVDEVMSPAVEISFTDANGNIDLDKDGAAATISLATTGTFAGSATTSLDATNGQATFDNLLFSAEGSGITITATDADGKAVPDLESQAFNVTNTSSTGKMIISEMCDPYDNYANDRYIEITNIDDVVIDLTGWSIDAIINDGSGVAFTWNLSGTLDPNESLTCGDTDNSVFTPDFAETDWSTSNSSWNGNEGDGAKLYDGSKALVDDAATPDGGSNYFENDAIIRLLRVSQPASPFNPGEWYAASVSTPSESTPGYHINVWTGGTDNSWTEPTNWSQGVTTKELCHAIIKSTAANMPTIAAKAAGDVHDILIEENATLLGQENLTVNGTAFVEKSFTGYSAVDGKDGWYAVSPPVNGMTIAGSHFEPVIDEDDFYVYDEATNYWLNYYDENPGTLFDQFDAATGYMVAYATANAGTKSFAGSLNSNASYVLNPANSNTAWNLIGNPYPSKVTWADVLNTDVSSPKVLNATSGAWEDMGTEIGVGQGIFVYAESGSSSLTFELADQSPGGSKKSGEFNDFVKLLAGFNDDLSVQLLLQANQDASQNYEWKYDARYFYPVTSIPYLCAVTNDDIWVSKYVFASGEETTIIPIHFTVNEEQEINFSIEDFDANVGISKLTIEDTKLNTFTVLSDGSEYAFTANPDDNEMRFKLHAETTTGIHEATIEGLTIYTHANTLYLNSDKAGNARVEMYNVTGQKVMAKKVVMDGLTQITPQLPTGWYVVKVSTGEGMATEKVFIK